MAIIQNQKTLFEEKQDARNLAALIAADDNEWGYTAVRFGYLWVVAVSDENNKFVGYL